MKGSRGGRNGSSSDVPEGSVPSSEVAEAVVGHIGANLPADPELLMFVVQLTLHSGNASEAARALGWSPSNGRRIIQQYPGLRAIAQDAAALQSKAVVRRWADSHAVAIQKIHDLMDSEDPNVQLKAALAIVDRIEGKVPQKIEVEQTDPADIFASIVTRFVTALHVQRGMEVASAMLYAEQHPEIVEQWAAQHGLLTSGAEV
jgi:hypothetical protein